MNPINTIRFIPIEAIISCMSSYTFKDKWMCPIIQKGIAKFCEIQINVNLTRVFNTMMGWN